MNEPRDLPRVLAIDDTPGNLLTLGAMLSADHALQVATPARRASPCRGKTRPTSSCSTS